MSATFETSSASFSKPKDVDETYLEEVKLIESIKDLLDLFDGSEIPQETLFAAYKEVFGESLTALTHPADAPFKDIVDGTNRTILGFQQLFDLTFSEYAKMRIPCKLNTITTTAPDQIDYAVEFNFHGHPVTVNIHAKTLHGKVVYVERKETMFHSVENVKTFIATFDGSSYNYDRHHAAFENFVDEDVSALVFPFGTPISDFNDLDKRVKLGKEDFYNLVASGYAQMQTPVQLVSVVPSPGGVIDYFCELDYMGHEALYHLHAETKNGKILRVERKETTFKILKNMKEYFGLFDGSEINENELAKAFSKLVHKNATSLSYPMGTPLADLQDPNKRVLFNYEAMFERVVLPFAKLRNRAALITPVQMKPGGVLEYSVQGEYKGKHVKLQYRAETLGSQVLRFEVEKIEIQD